MRDDARKIAEEGCLLEKKEGWDARCRRRVEGVMLESLRWLCR
jgi:hypothetical protein